MKHTDRLIRLQAINKKIEPFLLAQKDDDKGSGAVKKAIEIGAPAATLYSAGTRAQGLSGSQILAKLRQNAGSIGKGGVKDTLGTMKAGAGQIASDVGEGAQLLWKGAKNLIGRIPTRFQTKSARLIELSAKLDKSIAS